MGDPSVNLFLGQSHLQMVVEKEVENVQCVLVCVISVSDVTVSLFVVSELLMSSVSSVTCVLSAFLMSHFVLLNSIPEGIVKSCLCIHMCAI